MKPYMKYLTAEERAAGIRFGALHKAASAGILKQGASFSEWPGNILKAVAITSLVAGVPIGVIAHHIGRKINAANKAELEKQKQIEYYSNAAAQLERNLASA